MREWTAPPEDNESDPLGEAEAAMKLRRRVRERFAVYQPDDRLKMRHPG